MINATTLAKGVTSVPGFVREYGLRGGLQRWAGLAYHRLNGGIDGRSLFEMDWDVCIILDACRADELELQREAHDWIQEISRFPSLASCTWNWLPRTLQVTPDDILSETTYVSANPFAARFCEPSTFACLDEVYEYAWDERWGTVLPRPVTDRAIHHGRTGDSDRLLVHYVQPHVPFLTDDADPLSKRNFDHDERSVPDAWDRVTRGELPRQTAIDRYRETLSTVLEDVDLLLENVDADDVVLTADHGEAFGEFGLYGHPQNVDMPCLTQVPWVETSATDRETHDPAPYEPGVSTVSSADQLRALGYTE
ncbi:hypothetical protein [Halorubellus salinus]|uniref:hypothetical protein n=1 Tax=Halorubellus salinus TaxID=755309 RepID=UPI001D06B840|nr:hypothetical protein [Halorubellus salinus]